MFASFTRFVLLLVVSTASQMSVTAPLPAVAVRLAGVVGLPVGSGSGVSVTLRIKVSLLASSEYEGLLPRMANTISIDSAPSRMTESSGTSIQ